MRRSWLLVLLTLTLLAGCNYRQQPLPQGWPDPSITIPSNASNVQMQSQPNAKGPGDRPLEAYTVFFDLPGDAAAWDRTVKGLESRLRSKGWYVMDRQDNEYNKANFYASPDAQQLVFLIMNKQKSGYGLQQSYSLEMQVEHTKRTVQASWKKL